MRTTIMTFVFLISTSFAATIDWTRLQMEMDYLESKNTDSEDLQQPNSSESKAIDSLSLRRKSIDEKDGIINLEPLFDEVNLKQASPVKSDQNSPKESDLERRIDGSVPKDAFEKLVE